MVKFCIRIFRPVKVRIHCKVDSMVLNAAFNCISVISLLPVHLSMLSGSSFTGTRHSILSKPLAASHITNVETMNSGKRGMNHVAMTIINPRKEYWPSQGSNQRPPVRYTEQWDSAGKVYSLCDIGCRTTRPKDNSPQDNSPHQNLAPRQLAPHSEDNSPQIRGQLAPHRRQLGPLLLLKKIKDKGVKVLNIFYQTYIFVIKCLYIYILMNKIFFLFLRFWIDKCSSYLTLYLTTKS